MRCPAGNEAFDVVDDHFERCTVFMQGIIQAFVHAASMLESSVIRQLGRRLRRARRNRSTRARAEREPRDRHERNDLLEVLGYFPPQLSGHG
jgi:hypothetical protein